MSFVSSSPAALHAASYAEGVALARKSRRPPMPPPETAAPRTLAEEIAAHVTLEAIRAAEAGGA